MGHTPQAGRPPAAHTLLGAAGVLLSTAAVSVAILIAANLRLRRQRRELEARAQEADSAAMMISHELAQPLASAASLAELLAVDWPGLSESDRRDLAVNIDRSVQRLITSVNEHLPRLRRAVQTPEPADSEVTGRR